MCPVCPRGPAQTPGLGTVSFVDRSSPTFADGFDSGTLSPCSSSFLEDRTLWGFRAGCVKGSGSWEGPTERSCQFRDISCSAVWASVHTSKLPWARLLLSRNPLLNVVGSLPPGQQAVQGHVRASGHVPLMFHVEPECQTVRETPPQGDAAAESGTEACVSVHAPPSAVPRVCPSQRHSPAVRTAPGCA